MTRSRPTPTRNPLPIAFTFACLAMIATPLTAQGHTAQGHGKGAGDRSAGKAEAHAEARADGKGSGPRTSRSSQTVTHRVVVENGRTVVDERTENGRRVPAGKGRGPGLVPPVGEPSAQIEELMERMRRETERQGAGLPPTAKGRAVREVERAMDSARAADSSRSADRSSSRDSSSSRRSTAGRSRSKATGPRSGKSLPRNRNTKIPRPTTEVDPGMKRPITRPRPAKPKTTKPKTPKPTTAKLGDAKVQKLPPVDTKGRRR